MNLVFFECISKPNLLDENAWLVGKLMVNADCFIVKPVTNCEVCRLEMAGVFFWAF